MDLHVDYYNENRIKIAAQIEFSKRLDQKFILLQAYLIPINLNRAIFNCNRLTILTVRGYVTSLRKVGGPGRITETAYIPSSLYP